MDEATSSPARWQQSNGRHTLTQPARLADEQVFLGITRNRKLVLNSKEGKPVEKFLGGVCPLLKVVAPRAQKAALHERATLIPPLCT